MTSELMTINISIILNLLVNQYIAHQNAKENNIMANFVMSNVSLSFSFS